jgi:hypothetical protein
MTRHPQPVPPIYQPEVAARAIVYAADHPRGRMYLVGASTLATVLANRIVPAALDRYLAKTGYDSQQTDELEQPRSDNLWQPLDAPGGHDYGAHGEFDERSHPHSAELFLSRHPALTTAGTAAAAALAALAIRRKT